MTTISFKFTFFPVGQGLFASGALRPRSRGQSAFRWVYDCGTSSNESLVVGAIEKFAPKANSPTALDLVMISHFDKDHISGVAELLARTRVRILLLPYVSLAERLLIAFADGVDTQDDRLGLYLDPVAYFRGIEGAQIDEIVFVPASGDGDPPAAEGGGEPPPEGRDPWSMAIDYADRLPDDQALELEKWTRDFGSVRFMRTDGRIRIANVWEFVPYNDCGLASLVTRGFVSQVERSRERLNGNDKQARIAELGKLRGIYDRTFGKSALKRNLISLFVYGAPVAGWNCAECGHFYWPGCCWWSRFDDCAASAILYSGDGYLDTPKRLNSLIKALGRERVERLHVLQVMHHGAKGNWHDGVAAALSPEISIFSSDPDHAGLGHPHAPVLRDFWTRMPIQVDRQRGFAVHGKLTR